MADAEELPSILSQRVLRGNLYVQLTNAVAIWVHVVSVQWVLTERGEPATIISLAPAALAVPFLLLALPVGILVGFMSRTKLMAMGTALSLVAATTVAVLAAIGADGALPMILSVLVIGSAFVLVIVSWQSLLPETVDRRLIPVAALFDGASFNLARAVGPLLAGAVLGLVGAEWSFALVAALSAGCTTALVVRHRRAPDRTRPRRPVLPELSGALRYVRHSRWTLRLLFQLSLFGIPSSALWALVSLVVHERMGMGPSGFGAIMALIGIGAVVSGLSLGGLRTRMGARGFAALGVAVYASGLAVMATSGSRVVIAVAMIFVGAAWVSVQSTWMSMGHQFFPEWIRPRLIAFLLLFLQGTQAVGALLWGVVSDRVGLEGALLIAAGLMVVCLVSLLVFGLGRDSGITPVLVSEFGGGAQAWGDEPSVDAEGVGSGSVEVSYEYVVRPDAVDEFHVAMSELRRSRLRLGGRGWSLRPAEHREDVYLEVYRVDSFAEFAEQERDRLTVPESGLRQRVDSLATTVSGPRFAPATARGGRGA